jgi:hypothetical protein|tara:strand:+ start:2589 stop:2783 length:195 start_codon:yes stop_codon:yes gene_type:complete
MVRGRIKPLIRPFPRERQHNWKQQQLFMKLSNQNQDTRSPFDSDDQALYGDSRALYGQARYYSS